MNKQLEYQNKNLDRFKVGEYFVELETNSCISKCLLLLVNKILSIPCSNAFVERMFSLMSSCWTDTKNVEITAEP